MNIKDIEVGMYTRIDGKIGLIEEINHNYISPGNTGIVVKYNSISIIYHYSRYEKKFKASCNILDIIEVGDYVNGMLVDEIIKQDGVYHRVLRKFSARTIKYDEIIELYTIEKEIKSIVTKECFERGKFEV